jgi:hypothetical protein
MSDPSHDHPDVAMFPPVIPLATLGIACGVQWLMPLDLLVGIGAVWRIGIGVIAVIAGALITISGRIALVRLGTNVPITAHDCPRHAKHLRADAQSFVRRDRTRHLWNRAHLWA